MSNEMESVDPTKHRGGDIFVKPFSNRSGLLLFFVHCRIIVILKCAVYILGDLGHFACGDKVCFPF